MISTTLNPPKNNNLLLISLFTLSYILIGYLANEFIFTEEVLRNTFQEQLSNEFVEKIIEFKKSFWAVELVSPGLFYIGRFLLTALVFYIGYFILNNREVSFSRIFKVILLGEPIIILSLIIKYALASTNNLDNIEDINAYMPLSFLSISGIQSDVDSAFHYALKTINFFELAYILYFIVSFKKIFKMTYTKSLTFVSFTYVLGLAIWCLLLTLLTINFSA